MTTPLLILLGTPFGPTAARCGQLVARQPDHPLQAALDAFQAEAGLAGALPTPAALEAAARPGADTLRRLHTLVADIAATAGTGAREPAPPQPPAWMHLDGGCFNLEAQAHAWPQARWLLLLDNPVQALATDLAAGRAPQPHHWLSAWRDGATRLLRHVQAHPQACLLLDLPAALRQSAEAAACISRLLGHAAQAGPSVPVPPDDPLCRALAQALVGADRAAQRLYEELSACCQPLSEAADPWLGLRPLRPQEQAEAARTLSTLRQALAEVPRLQAGLAQAAQEALAQGQAHAERLAQTQGQHQREQQRLVEQLQALREELQAREQAWTARELAERAREATARQALEAELRSTRQGLAELRQTSQAAQADLAQAHARLEEAHQAHAQARHEAQTLAQAQGQAQSERLERLQAQLDQARAQVARLTEALEGAQALGRQWQDRAQALVGDHGQLVEQLALVQVEHEEQAQAWAEEREATALVQADLQAQRHQLAAELQALQVQLQEVQTQHQGAVAQAQAVERALAAHERHAEAQARQAADAAQVRWQADRAGLEAECQALRRQRDEAAASQAQALHDQQALTLRLEAAHRDGAVVLQQLHHVQEELEFAYQTYCQESALAAAAAAHNPWTGALRLLIDRVELQAERDTPPHRELQLTLRGVRLAEPAGTHWDAVHLRLVEHHGHAGFVVFREAGADPLFQHWQDDGEEAGRPFMMLIPADEVSRSHIDALGARDWALLHALTGWVEDALRQAGRACAPRWLLAVRRLTRELRELPPRLHYDGVQLQAVPGEGSDVSLMLRFGPVACAGQQLPLLRLRWQVGQLRDGRLEDSRLELLATETEHGPVLPLVGWPLDAQGLPLDGVTLPLSQGPDLADRQAAWERLGRSERDLMFGLLACLPAVLRQAADQQLPAAWPRDRLAQAAAGLPEQVRGLWRASRIRQVVGSLLGRPQRTAPWLTH
ncbi:hypothetical protein [Ideonella livida]|uniref:Uncharacterized protein n=1 Tax=Ideonella livida TaxID=2707176 RepID=A0A7C9PKK9_9BURK|nr:hypothetical protein [Ideonella livida]NDY93414.1 hypothetical protein [Ideonella livida]